MIFAMQMEEKNNTRTATLLTALAQRGTQNKGGEPSGHCEQGVSARPPAHEPGGPPGQDVALVQRNTYQSL